jgi:intein-encoded DNA endonuclease-like protein
MAYILGFLMADGNVSKSNNKVQVCLSEQDADFLEIFYKEIGGAPIAHYTQNNGKQEICRWQCLSSQIKKDLIDYDVIPHKTGFAKIPNKLNKKYYPDFIRGYFDGDGSIWIEKNGAVGFSITSHNKEILEQIIEYFKEQGIPEVKIKTDNRCNINYSFKYRKKASEKIYDIFYYNNTCLYMKRKFDKFTEILKK